MIENTNHTTPDQQQHILVVDDDERLRSLLSRYLTENGLLVTTAVDAQDAREKLEFLLFDLLIVDVMMPGEDGLSLTRALRQNGNQPILLLTAKGEVGDRIEGLEAGADDYLVKPFEPRELLLRVNSILRRVPEQSLDGDQTMIGPWQFDAERRELKEGANILNLTEAENKLLVALVDGAGQILSREKLAELSGMPANERTVDVQVTRLRKKLEEDPKTPRYLQTVRGKGYVLRTGQ